MGEIFRSTFQSIYNLSTKVAKTSNAIFMLSQIFSTDPRINIRTDISTEVLRYMQLQPRLLHSDLFFFR